MAEIKFSQLTTAAQLTNDDIFALAQMQGGSLSSVKTSMIAVANFLNTQVQYTTAYNTQAKTTAGAINELKQLISLIPQFSIEVVEELPTEDISDTTIYLVPAEDPEVGNYYEEYIHVNDSWELVGTTAVDLSAYYTKLEVDGLLATKASVAEVALKENKTDMPTDVRTIIKDCKTPKSATITNGIAQFDCIEENLVKGLKVTMNPIQDLHGYDNPWVGGAGKNKFQTTATSSGNFTVNSDGTVTVNGSFSGTSQFTVGTFDFKANTQYKLVGCPSGGGGSSYALYARGTEDFNQQVDQGNGVTFTPATDVTTEIRVIIYSGYTASNVLFKPMISTDTSVTYATFAPYSNICPISGRTEVSVTRTGKNFFDTSLFQRKAISGGTGEPFDSTTRIMSNDVIVEAGSYTYQNSNNYKTALYVYNADGSYPAPENEANWSTTNPRTVTFGGKRIVRLIFAKSNDATITLDEIGEVQIEKGSTATAYEPYTAETHTHQYGQTVYGGVDDFVNGVCSNERNIKVYDGTEDWQKTANGAFRVAREADIDNTKPYISNMFTQKSSAVYEEGKMYCGGTYLNVFVSDTVTTVEDFKAILSANNLQFVYYKTTPTTIQTSAEEITTVAGTNIISGTEPISECKYTELATVDDLIKIIGGQ